MKQLWYVVLFSCGVMVGDDSLFRSADPSITLDSTLIKMVDGNSIGINGDRVRMMLQVRMSVKKMLNGERTPAGDFVGIYEYNNAKYTIHELAAIEAQAHEQSNLEVIHDMHPTLQFAKKHFMQKVKPFMANARGAKGQMLLLIEESCKKRKRFDSILLRWGAAREEEETKQFDKDVIDFKTFETFCIDLVHFIEDVIRSCPKALAQYKQLVEREGHKPHN